MNRVWLLGLLRRRFAVLMATAAGVAVAVALVVSLGSFLTVARATMTRSATSGVAVDWQVLVHPGTTPAQAANAVRNQAGVRAALPVGYADTTGLSATARGTSQQTGPGKVLGLPPGYLRQFPGTARLLTGRGTGVLVAQQTAANLQVRPGDRVSIGRAGLAPVTVRVAGVVELPQADSLFQVVGAPLQSQPPAPPDNVMILPQGVYSRYVAPLAKTRPDLVSTQLHVRTDHRLLPRDPAAAYVQVTGAAKHLEVASGGTVTVGDNLAAVLDSARQDARYADLLFLFLGAPGVVLAGALTAAVADASAGRRRREQALLAARGASRGRMLGLVVVEAALVVMLGGGAGLLVAALLGRLVFGSFAFGSTLRTSLVWAALALAVAVLTVGLAVVNPARRDLGRPYARGGSARPRWLGWGLDLVAVAATLGLFWAAGRNQYQLVLAPEGVPTISVSYWAFLVPALGWVGAFLLAWRFADTLLGRGRPVLRRALRPWTGALAPSVTAMMSRQRRVLARSAILVGVAIAFAISTSTFAATYRQQAEVDAQLTNGADVTATASPGAGLTRRQATTIAAVRGVAAVQPLQHRFAYVGNDLQDLYGINAARITTATTLQDAYFQQSTAAAALARLGSRPDGVLVSAETVNDYQLTLGDRVRLRLQDARGALRTVTFRYVGIVNEFPTAPKDSFIVANASYVAARTGDARVQVLLANTGGSNIASVAARVRQTLGNQVAVTTLNDTRGLVASSLTSVDLTGLTRIELAFALLLVLAAAGVVTGLGLNERRRTTAVTAALGATRSQLRSFSIGEPAYVAVVGSAVGLVAGATLSYLLVKVLSGVFDPPPARLAVPWLYVAVVLVSTIAALSLAGTVVAARSRRLAVEYLREL